MKKFLMIALCVLFAGNAMALDNVPETGFSWQAILGMNVSGMKGSDLNKKVGANFGVKVDYVLPNAYGTYINAGVDWSQKGAKNKSGGIKHIRQAHYLEVPIHVGYRYNINEKFGVYTDLGPYFAVGVTGKDKYKYDDALIDATHTMTFGKSIPFVGSEKMRSIQRFDCGFGFRIGTEYNNQYSLNLAWDWGFTDAYTADYRKAYAQSTGNNYPPKLKNHNFSLTFGYRF